MNNRQGLSFSIFGFRVEIHFLFWLTALLLGANIRPITLIIPWIFVVLVSILLHELAHAALLRMFGTRSFIRLYGMGGVTQPTFSARPIRRWQEILVSMAGPLAGLLFGGVIFVLSILLEGFDLSNSAFVTWLLTTLIMVNVGWSLFNLLPILPMDGGNIFSLIFQMVFRTSSDLVPRIFSCILCAGALLLSVSTGEIWLALLSAWFLMNNIGALINRSSPHESAI